MKNCPRCGGPRSATGEYIQADGRPSTFLDDAANGRQSSLAFAIEELLGEEKDYYSKIGVIGIAAFLWPLSLAYLAFCLLQDFGLAIYDLLGGHHTWKAQDPAWPSGRAAPPRVAIPPEPKGRFWVGVFVGVVGTILAALTVGAIL